MKWAWTWSRSPDGETAGLQDHRLRKLLYEQKKKNPRGKEETGHCAGQGDQIRPGTADHDYDYRMEMPASGWARGDKVRAAIAFRGREMTHRELGAKILKKLTGPTSRHR